MIYAQVRPEPESIQDETSSPPKINDDAETALENEQSLNNESESSGKVGFGSQLPILPLLSVVFALALSAYMVVIVVLAHKSKVSSWTVSPTVLLAIAFSTVNMVIPFARSAGAAVNWWFLCENRPTQIRHLHWRWAAGQGAWNALSSLRAQGLSTAATVYLLVLVANVNSPLGQRALDVETRLESHNVTLDGVYAATQPPMAFSASISGREPQLSVLSEDFRAVMQEYMSQGPIRVNSSTMRNGTYKARLTAAGYFFNCTDSTINVPSYKDSSSLARYISNMTEVLLSSITYQEVPSKNVPSTVVSPRKSLSFNNLKTKPRFFGYDALWKPDFGCINATHGIVLKTRDCEIRPALVRYPILISNYTLQLDPVSTYVDDEIVSLETPAEINEDTGAGNGSTHGGIALVLDSRYSANYSIQADSLLYDVGWWNRFVKGLLAYELVTERTSCDIRFKDPTPVVFAAARELIFRSAMRTGRAPPSAGASRPSAISMAVYTETVAIYVASYPFLFAAVAVTVVAALCTLPLFHGFWRLGRGVSLSPVEVVAAFRHAQFDGAPASSSAAAILKAVGEQELDNGGQG
ncbi:hypothetical protein C2857_000404 [Epichloe festucae Fl1]|uniref:Uncharacterized protein n=1 Tax=Epichloe festucae (strain Fl1) TaxID=877507 RepID=A0A7S9PRY4_EPIFF|nr:hypothetical protein C2857_000404 [Epichloe festucae Fl1]